MEQRPLGRTGHTISAIGLGCVTFGREIDRGMSCRILDYAVENGITWFDTAEAYGGGNAREYRRNKLSINDEREVAGEMGSSESIIGQWMKARACRDNITICTKVSTGNSPENIQTALDRSLERLKTDYIDIYELHQYDPTVPIDETLSALTEKVDDGLINIIGCSNFSAAQLQNALDTSAGSKYARFEIIQPAYSLVAPEAGDELFPLCRQEQVAVTTYSPLAAGFLTGKYTPDQKQFPKGSRFDIIQGHADIYFSEHNFKVVEKLKQKSGELGQPMVRLAMAWVMLNPAVTSVLIGARKLDHIDNALAALKMKLEPDLCKELINAA